MKDTTAPMNRRREDTNLIAYAHRLFSGELVSPLVRGLCLAYALGAMWWGGGLIFDSGNRAYANPVFDGLFSAAHPNVWGLAWWFAGLLMLLTALTGRAIFFLWALVATSGVLTGWVVGVVAQTIISDDAVLSSGAIALYTFAYTGIAAATLSPRPLEYTAEILERDETGVIVPLKPGDRRAS